jgi:Ankyrin repeats (3 copies)
MTDANTDGARMVAACTSGDEATVRELLRETPPLARQVLVGALAPLHYAVREGHAGIVQLLLQHRIHRESIHRDIQQSVRRFED